MMISTSCNKCGSTVQLELGQMTKEEAEKAFRRMDQNGGHCPGQHMELGGLWSMWNLDEVLHRAYDLNQATPSAPLPTDEEHVESLRSRGKEVWDGGANKVPGLNLPSLHSITGLSHMGSGNFASSTHVFLRSDSPLGTRFYVREPR